MSLGRGISKHLTDSSTNMKRILPITGNRTMKSQQLFSVLSQSFVTTISPSTAASTLKRSFLLSSSPSSISSLSSSILPSSSSSSPLGFTSTSTSTLGSSRNFASKDEYAKSQDPNKLVSDYYFYSKDPFKAFEERGKGIVPSKHPGVPALPPPFSSIATRQRSLSRMKGLRITPKKLNEMCILVRGLGVQEAIIQMKYFGKLRAKYLAKCINRAAKTSVVQYNMDRSRLYVAQAYVNQSHKQGYRMDFKGKHGYGVIQHKFCNLTVILQEQPLMVVGENGRVAKITGQKNRYWGASHTNGVEVRIGRRGRKLTTIERTSRMMAEYKAVKRRMGLEKEPLPLPSRYASTVLA